MNTPSNLGPFHNPDALTDEQIGTKDGWRLLRLGEAVPEDYEFWMGESWNKDGWSEGKITGNESIPRRTKRPDPLAAPVAGWTRFSDKLPDGPFYAWYRGACDTTQTRTLQPEEAKSLMSIGYTHWHPAPPLPEPPREETQADKDEAAFRSLWDNRGCHDVHPKQAWHAALAWERGGVEKMLPESPMAGGSAAYVHAIKAIRARCGGGA